MRFFHFTFIFASEIKSILSHPKIENEINKKTFYNYFRGFTNYSSETLFKNIYQILPSQYIILKQDSGKLNIENKSYYFIKGKIERHDKIF